jgi:hypothetical protein
MGIIRSEIKVGLNSPPIVGLKLIEERRRHSPGNIRESRFVNGVGREQDSEKDRWLAVRIRSNREAHVAHFPCVEHFFRFDNGLFELRLMYETGGSKHNSIIARGLVSWRGMRALIFVFVIARYALG